MFIFSCGDIKKRENAKETLKENVIMMILVNSSFFIYENIIATLGSISLFLIGNTLPSMFIEGFSNVYLEFIVSITTLFFSLITLFILALRYCFLSIFVIFFPVCLTLYFFRATREYGSALIQLFIVFLFLPFFYSIILSTFSGNILTMCLGFILIDFLTFYFFITSVLKAISNMVLGFWNKSKDVFYLGKFFN